MSTLSHGSQFPFQNSKRKIGALIDFPQDKIIVFQTRKSAWMTAAQYYHKAQHFSSILAIFHV
jgi:hypothetical protein